MSKKIIKFNVSVPTDEGFVGRKCCKSNCGRYFKVKTDSLGRRLFCPYCGAQQSTEELRTKDQAEYFTQVAVEKAKKMMFDEVDKVFGSLGRKRRSKNVIFKHKPIRYREKSIRPKYEELQVDSELICSQCDFPFQVYGIFGHCPGCGSENLWIYDANFAIIQKEITDNPNPQRSLRHAYSDLVSTFEIFCLSKSKLITNETTRFQILFEARKFFKKHLGTDIFSELDENDILILRRVFQKRHLYEHDNGIINEKYTRMIPEDANLLGQLAELSKAELENAAGSLRNVLDNLSRAVEK